MNYRWQRRPRLIIVRKNPETNEVEFAALVRGFRDGPVLQAPGGGCKHETDEQCLYREVYEETGILINTQELTPIETFVTPIKVFRRGEESISTIELPFYFTASFSGTLKMAEPEKFLYAGWCSRNMIDEVLHTYGAIPGHGLIESLDILEIH
jgi:8-oxo-dGTP pyrophosphatase MutT (NUDIX family)